MYPWLIAIALVLLFIYLYNQSNGEGFLNYYPYRYDNDRYPYRYDTDRYPYRYDTDRYPYRNPCQNCGYLRERGCSNCSNCGWCINRDGKGQCVPGTAAGPLFTQDCVYYSQNERPFGQRYPYRRRFWENVWGNNAINENKTI